MARATIPLNQTALLERGCNEAGEERMRIKRAALEFGVELHPYEPWMIGPLNNFGELTIG